MTAMSRLARVTTGALFAVLLAAVAYLGAQWALGELDEVNVVEVTLGEIGQGVVSGSDVKMRGVIVGEVGEITLDEDLNAVAELVLEPPHRVPERADFAITAKTLLGEKQVDIVFDGSWDDGPFLADGARVDDPERVVELQDVLAELTELFDAIDPDDLAVLVSDGLGAFDGQGPAIARSVDEGARAADTFARSLDDQTAGLHDLSLVAEELGRRGGEFNRMADELVVGLPTLSDNQPGTRRLLDELSRFAPVLDATLTVDRPSIDRMLVEGDSVTRMLFAYRPEVGELVSGLADYTSKWDTGFESEATTGPAARFIAFIDVGLQEVCAAPGLAEILPACDAGEAEGLPSPDGEDGPGLPESESVEVPVGEVEVPPEAVRPQDPDARSREGLPEVMDRAMEPGSGR